MVNYNYRVKHEFLKKREDGSCKLEDHGFIVFTNEENQDEKIYMASLLVRPDCFIVRGLVADLNNPDWQRAADISNPEQQAMLAANGLRWEEQEDGTFKVIETEELIDEFRIAHLCVSNDKNNHNFPYGTLLLKGADGIFRAGVNKLKQCCPEVIEDLLNKGIIYKKRAGKISEKKKEEESVAVA